MHKFVLRIGLAICLSLVVGLIFIGFEVYLELTTRYEAMSAFTRLAVKNAIVNIQTTEESGNDAVAYLLKPDSISGYRQRNEQKDYEDYLNTLAGSLAARAEYLEGEEDPNLELIQAFLASNESESGNDRFRPIQFGMTYVSPELFKASLKQSLYDLIQANYAANGEGNLALTQDDAVYIGKTAADIDKYVTINIDGPKAALIPEDGHGSVLYSSIYGTDKAESSLSALGFEDLSIGFYVYYDITVEVNWKSTTLSPLLKLEWLGELGMVGVGEDNFDSNGFLRIPGKPVTYSYRYVLTN